jgi:hypothetical protein
VPNLSSVKVGVSTAFVVLKYTVIILFVVALAFGVYAILKALGVFGPSPDEYNRVVEQFNQLANQYNRAVRRSYMVYIKVGQETEGLPIRVKLVTTNQEQAIEIEPVFTGMIRDQAGYEANKIRNSSVMCYQEKTTDNNTSVCARSSLASNSAPGNVEDCYTVPLCNKGPTCTVLTPYTDRTTGLTKWSDKRALGLSVFMNRFGTMQIKQLSLQVMDPNNGSRNNNLDQSRGEFAPEYWDVFGKIWDCTNYDLGKQTPSVSNEVKDAGLELDQVTDVFILPKDIQENSYYKLWVNALGAVKFAKSSLPEYKRSITDTPLAPILGPQDPVSDLGHWKGLL